MGVENFCTKVPKGTPLRQIWSNKSFGVCGSDVVLTLESDERKKYARIAIGKSMSSITLRPRPRRRDNSANSPNGFITQAVAVVCLKLQISNLVLKLTLESTV